MSRYRFDSTRHGRPRYGGSRSGFTLIELLIVVIVIGILVAIVVPKFQNTKGKANAAALKSDLHNLTTAEESYFYDNATYTDDVTSMKLLRSPGVVLNVVKASGSGWAAIATHPASYPLTCAIFFGAGMATSPATAEGVIGCN